MQVCQSPSCMSHITHDPSALSARRLTFPRVRESTDPASRLIHAVYTHQMQIRKILPVVVLLLVVGSGLGYNRLHRLNSVRFLLISY